MFTKNATAVLLLIVGAIHLLPALGVTGAERLSTIYGISFTDPNEIILMRHRAVLFGLLGAFLAFAAFKPSLQPLALAAGLVSVASFLFIAWTTGEYNQAIQKVVLADLVAIGFLLIAIIMRMTWRFIPPE